MRDDRRLAPPESRGRPGGASMLLAVCLALLTACGGGGGGEPSPSPAAPSGVLDGLAGTVRMPGRDLGAVLEQEPNDDATQAFRLPPLWAGSTAQVAGTLAAGIEPYGRVDPVDVLRVVALADQRITLRFDVAGPDGLGDVAPAASVTVTTTDDGAAVASLADAAPPVLLAFDASGGQVYDVRIRIPSGHAAWRLTLSAQDLGGSAAAARRPVGAVAAGPAAATVPGAAAEAEPDCAETHVLVRLRPGCDVEDFCRRRGLTRGDRLATGSYRLGFAVEPGTSARRKAVATGAGLALDPDVLWATPDWIVRPLGTPDDAEFPRQWNLGAIGAPAAWDVVTGDPSVVVAVLDTGIVAHPDLLGQTVPGYDFVSTPEIAADGDGRDPDPTDPGDRFGTTGLSTWHGTHVAAIVGARQGDAYGISGVAPGCRIMPVRVLGLGGGYVSDAADAILYCAGQFTTADGRTLPEPVDVLNLSLGLAEDSPDLRDACDRAANLGVFLVGAAGNTNEAVLYPAAYPSVVAVAAVDGGLETTPYSNFGPQIEFAAPGGMRTLDRWGDGWPDGVLSAVIDETVAPAVYGHGYVSGTSQAAPHVAGAAALLLSLDPSLTVADLRAILRATALDRGPVGDDPAYGAGIVQVHRAAAAVLERLGMPRADPPSLLLPTTTLAFDGLRDSVTVPLGNGGGGALNVFLALCTTDDGASWLSATLVPDTSPDPAVNMRAVTVHVDRSLVPAGPGRYTGVVRLGNLLGTLGTLRVTMFVQDRTRWGELVGIVALDPAAGIARRKGYVAPEFGYRYWMRELPEARYLLIAGEDLDGDGFLCEPFDACGYYGGPTESQAIPVAFLPGKPAIVGLDIWIATPP